MAAVAVLDVPVPLSLLLTHALQLFHFSPFHSQMETQTAEALLAQLKDIFFYVTIVESALTVSTFSTIPGSILYGTPPAKVSALELFKVSPAVLEGKGNIDERAATRRLMDVLDDEESIPGLITKLSEEPTERL